MNKPIHTTLLTIFAAALLSSCGSDTRFTSTTERSVGQQLSDLSDAHEQGIITDREYEKLKKAIIREHD